MNINRLNLNARLTGVAVALALFAGVAVVNAQNGAKGGAIKLLELNGGRVTAKSEVSSYTAMSCAKCKDELVRVRDPDSKGGARALLAGAAPLSKSVSRHGCGGCGTDWNVVGHGKTKISVASHKCTSCGDASLACCNTKKGADLATKGMERLEVAPLK